MVRYYDQQTLDSAGRQASRLANQHGNLETEAVFNER